MKSVIKVFAVAIALTAAMFYGVSSIEAQDASPAATSADYPVLLIHGLGEQPGEAAFGRLEEYLEAFFFDVEVMDFNETNIPEHFDHQNHENLEVLAAAFGKKVKEMTAAYDVEKINVIASSYGGLIVQAYILDRGAAFNKQFGTFEFDIDKVMYLSTPFYGYSASDETLLAIAEDTDYGQYTRPAQLVLDAKMGSYQLFGLDATLRSFNIYAFDVEPVTIVANSDQLMDFRAGILGHFTGKYYPFKQYRVLAGYSHCAHPLSADGDVPNKSLGYIDDPNNRMFSVIVSFLDAGRMWRKAPVGMPQRGMVILKHDGNGVGEGDATLTYLRKNGKKGKSNLQPGQEVAPTFNELTGVFTWNGLSNGIYELKARGNQNLTQEVEVIAKGGNMTLPAYSYNAKKNELEIGDGTAAKLNGVYTLNKLEFKNNNKEAKSDKIKGLNLQGFEITFFVEGGEVDKFDKGRVFAIYNQDGSREKGWNKNGGRLEIQLRGTNVANGDLQHAGKISLLACVDHNENGELQHNLTEDYETKSVKKYNWAKLHKIQLRVEYNRSTKTTVFTLWVDGEKLDDFDLRGDYYNPNPYISFGGRRHDKDYFAPKGIIVTDFVIRNLDN